MQDEYLTPLELSKMLKVSRPWPYLMIKRGRLPYFKMNKIVRFRKSDIEAYLEKSRHESKG